MGSARRTGDSVRAMKPILFLATVAALAALSAEAGAAAVQAPAVCIVPRLAGSTIPAAKLRLAVAGCRLGGIALEQPRDRVARVVGQVPAPGAVLPTLAGVVLGVG
jgi:beta-lactam-binding protein with PASTA domain